MGIQNWVAKRGAKAADKIAKLAVLSPEQLNEVQANREKYLSQMPNMTDEAAVELTLRLLAACSTEIFNSYLNQLTDYYVPVEKDFNYDQEHLDEFKHFVAEQEKSHMLAAPFSLNFLWSNLYLIISPA